MVQKHENGMKAVGPVDHQLPWHTPHTISCSPLGMWFYCVASLSYPVSKLQGFLLRLKCCPWTKLPLTLVTTDPNAGIKGAKGLAG